MKSTEKKKISEIELLVQTPWENYNKCSRSNRYIGRKGKHLSKNSETQKIGGKTTQNFAWLRKLKSVTNSRRKYTIAIHRIHTSYRMPDRKVSK